MNEEPKPSITRQELIEIVQQHIDRIQAMPVDMMLIPVNHADLVSILLMLSASLHIDK
jgi:hypothetical protein